ncbi:hypothetical protein [Nocardia asteroides]|uniref:hypothetical protein n=1 Tax=Nocardia asteroides TaxID=1824 RepID=UPI001E4308EA|nr:hypothetical protein [Nocardia asteroides]UGT56229.1 hypothetical protein LTT85_04905 [Nocardia asteroides]
MTLTDRLIAPGATRPEITLGFTVAACGAAGAAALAVGAQYPWFAVAVLAVLAFDLFGGAVVNAMGSAKRWYHRPGRTAGHHLGFVAIHIQPFLLAAVVPAFSWAAAATVYVLTLAGAVVVTATPGGLRRPVAFAVTTLGLLVVTGLFAVPAEVGWFAPVLMIKLLLAHVLPEEAA